ncbi:sulfotransferase family 5A, member 1 [Polypterus senegalus]|nr:sulfotransferase family 5A, member 1 [Polypterus senegalus]
MAAMARMDVTETFHHIKFCGHLHTQESLRFAQNFDFLDSDILIATYPKSGTTWMQQIVSLLLSNGNPQLVETIPNWARAPWLEQYYFKDLCRVLQSPRILSTHLPYEILAPALQGSRTKVINVIRNPKDAAVSYYFFHKMANFLPDYSTFDEFLNSFLDGTVHYGSWFDHVKGWEGNAKNLNIFYITYEELFQDLGGSLEKISHFLECSLLPEELSSVQRNSTFGSMKDNSMVNYTLIPNNIMDHSKGQFMRQGKIGDWKHHFTSKQNTKFNDVFNVEMSDSKLEFVWE